jgi:hypothetical protein
MMAAAMCGTMPKVQPKAATMLARDPRDRPVASVNSTPVPGETTTISDVIRNSMVMKILRYPYRPFAQGRSMLRLHKFACRRGAACRAPQPRKIRRRASLAAITHSRPPA